MTFIKRYSNHAQRERMQQRGVSHQLVDLASQYGEMEYDHRGAYHIYFSKQSIWRMIKAGIHKRLIQEAEKKRDLRFVVSAVDGCLITAKYIYGSARGLVNN